MTADQLYGKYSRLLRERVAASAHNYDGRLSQRLQRLSKDIQATEKDLSLLGLKDEQAQDSWLGFVG